MFRWLMPVAVLSSVLSLAAYQPSKPENPSGTIPSRLASYVWTHYPRLDNPVPGVFFAREAHSGANTYKSRRNTDLLKDAARRRRQHLRVPA